MNNSILPARNNRTVLHIGTADNSGGAARAAYRIHDGLRSISWNSRMLVAQKVTADDSVKLTRPNVVWKAADRLASIIQERVGLQDIWYPSIHRIRAAPDFRQADVVQFHNLHGRFFPIPAIAGISSLKPTAWTLHDMWSFTGHCVYSYGNDKWMTGCGNCPQLRTDHLPLRYDTTAFHWRLRKKTYARSHLHIVAPSRWMQGLAQRSPLLSEFQVHHIPYGIDASVFFPIDKPAARRALMLPPDRTFVLFTAHAILGNPRKGFEFFRDALQRLTREEFPSLEVLVMGAVLPGESHIGPFPIKSVGFVTDDALLAHVHSAADLLVAPSIADNLPLTIMESMACGTPVVAFDSGGVPDLIRTGVTGITVPTGDAEALSAAMRRVLMETQFAATLRANALQSIATDFTMDRVAKQYEELYTEMIAERPGSTGRTARPQ